MGISTFILDFGGMINTSDSGSEDWGFESHRCSKNIITEAEFELSDEES